MCIFIIYFYISFYINNVVNNLTRIFLFQLDLFGDKCCNRRKCRARCGLIIRLRNAPNGDYSRQDGVTTSESFKMS